MLTLCALCTGKSGQVAQRFSSSLSSVGISSQYVHAAEWVHGDLGKVVHFYDCSVPTHIV